jgi:hypothetical protein
LITDNNRAIFSGPSGRFIDIDVKNSNSYTVVGEEVVFQRSTAANPVTTMMMGPFGSFTTSAAYTCTSQTGSGIGKMILSTAKSRGPQHYHKKSFLKSIFLVTLNLPMANKPSTSRSVNVLNYTIITQTHVSIDMSCCSPSSITNSISSSVWV